MTATGKNEDIRGRVVVGFDGSEPSFRALDRAAEEAVRRDTALEVLCGWPWNPPPLPGETPHEPPTLAEETQAMVGQAVEKVRATHPGLEVIPVTTSEAVVPALVRHSETAALTVLGTRGHGGFTGLLLGSVSLRVAAHCASPLMIVRGEATDAAARGTVVVGVESDQDGDAVRFGFEEASRRGARLRALHAWLYPPLPAGAYMGAFDVPPKEGDERRKEAEALPRYEVAPFRAEFPDVEVIPDHECNAAAPALVEASRTADVIVLATHRTHRHLGLQLGPVTQAVLHHAHCPVVLVPTD
ncbi:universal stress protein [Streptomyces sp. F63]|uniref:universal stress protein n=1 Tax=Streptomyces sp. F63 TaxID=2824887 RepID=UPI001B3780CC|nr:universal stress protein [Streptomyces sp. F63]MBQ0983468.1 universal stress protein [Streptomyces sp. F63]